MTNLVSSMQTDAAVRRPRVLLTLTAGAAGGMVLGVAARAWMRLIAEDPGFTWGGTIFIVGGFTVFGLCQATAVVTRRRATRRWTLVLSQVVGTIGLLPLLVGAGALMLPTIVGGGFALARVEWRRRSRVLFGFVAAVPIALVGRDLVDSFGWSLHTAAGLLAMLALYATIVRAARTTFVASPKAWRLPRRLAIALYVGFGLVLVRLVLGVAFS